MITTTTTYPCEADGCGETTSTNAWWSTLCRNRHRLCGNHERELRSGADLFDLIAHGNPADRYCPGRVTGGVFEGTS